MNALAFTKPFFRGALTSLHDEIDSLLSTPWNWPAESVSAVPVDIEETDDAYALSFDLPGMEKKDVSVEVKDGVITVSGERKRDETKKGDGYTYRERSFGAFSRSFRLPDNVKEDSAFAKLKDGILEVRLTKYPEAKPKRISVD